MDDDNLYYLVTGLLIGLTIPTLIERIFDIIRKFQTNRNVKIDYDSSK